MFTGNTLTKITTALTVIAVVALGAGCKSDQSTASFNDQQTQYNMLANSSLGAGDGLGNQVFSTDESTTRVAVIRTAEQAIMVAEAKEAEGSYDQWYASFDRNPEHIRLAKANQSGPIQVAGLDTLKSDQPAGATEVVDVPIELTPVE